MITHVALGWAAVGFAVWVLFALRGAAKVVPGVKGSSVGFRLMILPGVLLLWPLVVARWVAWAERGAVD